MRKIFLSAILTLTITSSFAQKIELGGFLGASGYMGEFNQNKPYRITNLAYGGLAKYNFNPRWAAKLNVTHGTLKGSDKTSSDPAYKDRGYSFKTPLTEVGLQFEFNFFDYVPSISKKLASPYLFTGVAGAFFKPQPNWRTADGASKISIPYGVGYKYNFTGKWSLISEVGFRTASGYLDAYQGEPTLPESNFKKRDTYLFAGFSLTYTFVSQKCPEFR